MKIKVTSKSFSRSSELMAELGEVGDEVVGRPDAAGHLDPHGLIDFLGDADAAVVGLDQFNADAVAGLPNLRAVAKYGVGLDNVDVRACLARGIYVGWTPGLNRRSVSELALGAMLMLLRNAFPTAQMLRSGTWHKQGGVQLTGKTVGIFGVGHIGKDLIELLRPFGCRILGCDVRDQQDYYRVLGVEAVDFATLLAESDVVSIHAPLTDETYHKFDDAALALMKPGAILINTARGGLVDEAALDAALETGTPAMAALDVFEEEPYSGPLTRHENVVLTAHMGSAAAETRSIMEREAADNLVADLRAAGLL